MKKIRRSLNLIEALLILVIAGIVGFTGWYVYHANRSATKIYQTISDTQQMTAVPKKTSTAKVTYDHGKLVPADSQARAKAAGYYCPSWDAKPGEIAAGFCVALDK